MIFIPFYCISEPYLDEHDGHRCEEYGFYELRFTDGIYWSSFSRERPSPGIEVDPDKFEQIVDYLCEAQEEIDFANQLNELL